MRRIDGRTRGLPKLLFAAAVVLFAGVAPAAAQGAGDYPSSPVKIIVPSSQAARRMSSRVSLPTCCRRAGAESPS